MDVQVYTALKQKHSIIDSWGFSLHFSHGVENESPNFKSNEFEKYISRSYNFSSPLIIPHLRVFWR